jgi:cell wall-associated NlpC family hydrolase
MPRGERGRPEKRVLRSRPDWSDPDPYPRRSDLPSDSIAPGAAGTASVTRSKGLAAMDGESMMYVGQDLVDRAMTRAGQEYVLGARVHLANPDWSGPWDCAEFVSWCVYHAYRTVMAVRPPDVRTGESYSGWWYEDAVAGDLLIPVEQAIATPGAILIRKPAAFGMKIGHVAISRGDGTTIEARGAKDGVLVVKDAASRQWTTGAVVPGVAYVTDGGMVVVLAPPAGLLHLASPFMRGDAVLAVQRALKEGGVDPGPLDGIFGPATADAVAAFQAMHGLAVDGMVGAETRAALFP